MTSNVLDGEFLADREVTHNISSAVSDACDSHLSGTVDFFSELSNSSSDVGTVHDAEFKSDSEQSAFGACSRNGSVREDGGFDENSCKAESVADSGISEGSIITADMVKEEERLRKQRERAMEAARRKLEKESEQKELMEKRYESLLTLLKKSKFYADYALKKLQDNSANRFGKKKKAFFNNEHSEVIEKAAKRVHTSEIMDNENVEEKDDKLGLTRVSDLGITIPSNQPILLTGASLRNYQMDGLDWLKRLYIGGLSGILADEMGLGKTIQVISLICFLYEKFVTGPFLIVAPLSTLPNWMLEFENFAPDVPVVLFHGNINARHSLKKEIRRKSKLLKNYVYPVVITSYEVPLKEQKFFNSMVWKYMIVDEGHRLKNHQTKLSSCLSNVPSSNRLLLTGTPLQNNLKELWSMLHFLLPEMFMNLDDFCSWFQVEELERKDLAENIAENEKTSEVLSTFHEILAPFLLRRIKSEVDLNLPPKKELVIYCPVSKMQNSLYTEVINRGIRMERKEQDFIEEIESVLEEDGDVSIASRKSRRTCVLNRMTPSEKKKYTPLKVVNFDKEENFFEYEGEQFILNLKMTTPHLMLHKISNHPYLVETPVANQFFVDESLVNCSGKMVVLDTLLKKLKADNHKVLIFSCFKSILDILEEFMELRKYQCVRLDGNSKIESRKACIREFNADPEIFVFLLSTRAGGLGINLTAADTVVIFDSDWNPQMDLQAQDRCHRIGQTKPVIVYRLVSKGTIDEKICTRAGAKRKLEKMIIDAGKFQYSKNGVRKKNLLDFEDLKELFKEKQDIVQLSDDVLSPAQWEELLNRNF